MEKAKGRTPVKISASPWKLTLPGKILAVCICLLPFLTRTVNLTLSSEEKSAYFLSSDQVVDFEQYCREIGLIVIAVAALAWFVYERITMLPRRKMPMMRVTTVIMLCLDGYLLLGLISSIASDEQFAVWFGSYQLYEGYAALVGYAVVFAAAWYWVDRKEVVQFVENCLTVLAIVLGVLVLLEHLGYCYYNSALVQLLGNLNGMVSYESATLTFGNSDYLGMYAAMLLPLMTALIFCAESAKKMLVRIVAAVLMGTVLILTEVVNTILIGFGITAIFLLIWMFHTGWKRVAKLSVTGAAVIAVVAGGFGFVYTRSGDTLSKKLYHTMVGMEQEETFRLLRLALDGDTVTLENADTVLNVTAESETLSAETLTFVCNGIQVVPQESDGTLTFEEEALEHCQITVEDGYLSFQLGYVTPVKTIRTADGWQAVGIGETILNEVPQVSSSKWLWQRYPYLNGRVFVWANTVSVLDDCWLIGHGPATTLFYLNQNDLPALLNIFSTYALYNKPHNWYLQMAQDTGVLSALLVIAMLLVFTVCGCRRCLGSRTQWSAWRTGLWLAVIAYGLTGLMSDSLIYHAPMFWFLFGIGVREMTTPLQEEKSA